MIIIHLDSDQLTGLIQNAVRQAVSQIPAGATPPETDQLLTIQQAAELLTLAVPTIYGLVSRNEIPHAKKGKRLYFSRLEILDWIKSGRNKTNAEISADAESNLVKKGRG